MVSNGEKRGRPRRTEAPLPFVEQIAIGAPVAAASAFCRVHPNTGARWMKLPTTWDRVHLMRDEMYSEAVGRLSAALKHAVDTLVCLLNSNNEPIQIAAAANLCKLTTAAREHQAATLVLSRILEKIAAIEAGLAASGGK